MTPEEFAKRMQAIYDRPHGDEEIKHAAADDLLCQVLRELGYDAGVDIFENDPRGYA
jgi:hypothetical protein